MLFMSGSRDVGTSRDDEVRDEVALAFSFAPATKFGSNESDHDDRRSYSHRIPFCRSLSVNASASW